MNRRIKAIVGLIGICLLAWTGQARAQKNVVPDLPVATRQAAVEKFNDPGVVRMVREVPRLAYPRQDRWPLLIWGNGPDNADVLQAYIDRGLSPLFNRSFSFEATKNIVYPKLKQLQDNGVPVVILPQMLVQIMFIPSKPGKSWPPGRGHNTQSPSGKKSRDFTCPAWLYENPHLIKHGESFRKNLEFLREKKIDLAGVLIDFESGAYLRNGAENESRLRPAMEEAWKCSRCVSRFGVDAMDSLKKYASVVDQGRAYATKVGFTDQVYKVFPNAYTGNYYVYPTSRLPREPGKYPAYGYDGSGLNVLGPRKYFTAGWSGSGKDEHRAAWICVQNGLSAFSDVAKHREDDELLVPWLGNVNSRNAVREKRGDAFPPPKGYAELVRHMILRGAETFALFIPSGLEEQYPKDFRVPRKHVGPWLMVVQGVQQGYNDMLRFHDFLRQAKPLTYEFPAGFKDIENDSAVWSGVGTDELALVRTVTFGSRDRRKKISLFGKNIDLPFTRKGQFYWVFPDGAFESVSNASQ